MAEEKVILNDVTVETDVNKYADHKSLNGEPVPAGHVLAPVWLHRSTVKADKTIIQQNLTTWKFGGIGFLIGFAPIQEAAFAGYMKLFWQDINEYLESKRPGRCVLGRNDDGTPYLCPYGKHCAGCSDRFDDEGKPRERINPKKARFVSLEVEFGAYNSSEESEEEADMDIPDTQHLQPDQEVYLEMLFADLVRHLEKISPRYAEIVTLGKAGYEPDEIIAKINLKKSRGYQELAKAEELARKFIYGM